MHRLFLVVISLSVCFQFLIINPVYANEEAIESERITRGRATINLEIFAGKSYNENRLYDFASILGASVACDLPVEGDIALVAHWIAATFEEDTEKYLKIFQDELGIMVAKALDSAKDSGGLPCENVMEMREAAVEYLRATLRLYRLEGKLPPR